MIRTLTALGILGVLGGCAGQTGSAEPGGPPLRGLDAARRESSPVSGNQPATEVPPVVIAGEAVPYSELRPLLAEAGGAQAIEEIALERLISTAAAREGVRVTEDDVRAERAFLAETLARVAGVTPDQSERLIGELRRTRALGPARFEGLLRRQAMLRKMAAPRVEVSAAQLSQGLAIRFGPKVRARLIVAAAERDASACMSRLREVARSGGDVRGAFIREAVSVSSDESAARGGLVEPISASDPTFPVAFRQAIAGGTPGSLHGVIALDRGFAIALVEEIIPAQGEPSAAERERLERDIRLRAERNEMQKIADGLLRDATITVFDRDLRWAWEERRR